MEFVDESKKVIARLNILVYYDPNVKILLNRRLCELVVWLCNVANRICLPVWKRCEEALPLCQLALKEFYRQLILGETLIQSSSSQHFWKLREPSKLEKKTEGKTVEYLHSCDSALKDWTAVTVSADKPPISLRCDRIKHELRLLLDEDQRLCVEHSCSSADQQRVPVKFREGKVISLPCTSQHWLKLSIIGAPHGAFMVQFILDLFWHMIQVNRSLSRSQRTDGRHILLGSKRWAIVCCDLVLHQVYQILSDERKKGLGSFLQCQEDCNLLLTKLRYVMNQGLNWNAEHRGKSKLTAEEILHSHRNQVAEFVLHKLEDRFQVASRNKVAAQRMNSKVEFEFLPDYLNIEEKKVEQLRLIAAGGFSAVYECSCLGESLAAKHFEYIPPETQLRDTFRNELINLYKLKHFHIVQLVGYYIPEEHRHALLIELMEKDLRKKINTDRTLNVGNYLSPVPEVKPSPYPLHVSVDILLQIARGMKYSHDSGVMHRDIKSRNLLVKRITSNCNSERIDLSKEGYAYVKLTDFGLSTRLMYPTSNVGTSFWKAPEVIGRNQQEYSKSADVYSFAITCSEIFTGEEPFGTRGHMTNDQLHEVLMEGERPSLASCPPYLADYIRRCWDSNHENRPSFADICVVLQHYKGVLMRSTSDPSAVANYHIATEDDIVELVCHGGLFWATQEALKNGIDKPSQEAMVCSRIPKDVFLDCLRKWTYPGEAASSPELGLDKSIGTELASPSPGSILEGFESLCVVQFNWQEVLLNSLREAWQLVGDHYAAWSGGSHDFESALSWYRRAADNGHPDAFFRLGLCYESGYGVNQDMNKALEYYAKAADKNSTSACVCLGLASGDPDRVSYWQKALQYQKSKERSIWIVKIWIHIMTHGTSGRVYENAVTKLFNLSLTREDLVGRQLLAGPHCCNIGLFVDALRRSARDKQQATKVIIVKNLSMEPDMARKILEAGGTKVLLRLFKESFEPGSKLVASRLVQAFCNVNPIDHDLIIESFLEDPSDPSSGFKLEEVQKFYQLQDQLATAPPSPRPLQRGAS